APIPRPHRLVTTILRDGPATPGARERPHVDLVATRLVRLVRQPPAVRGEPRPVDPGGTRTGSEGPRLAIAIGFEDGDSGPILEEEDLTVGGPGSRPLIVVPTGGQPLRGAASVRGLPEKLRPSLSIRREHDPATVRCPARCLVAPARCERR